MKDKPFINTFYHCRVLYYVQRILKTENFFLLMHVAAIPKGICAAFSVKECYGQGISLLNLCSE